MEDVQVPSTYSDWVKYEPDAIRRAVPLQWAFGHLLDRWDLGIDMVQCPFHQDDTPSFNLWAADESGLPQRFGCFGCGASGDVLDLIQRERGVGFSESCSIAVQELAPQVGDWQPAVLQTSRKEPASPEALERVLAGLLPMDARGFDILLKFMRRKGMGGEAMERYAIDEWGWAGTMDLAPLVFFPHRAANGDLTGIKYRDTRRDGRWNEDGSRFMSLYGAWRDKGRADVFLAEGETDTVSAAFQLRDSAIDVFGLPSGAGQNPTEQMLAQLKDRTVYLSGDGDAAGMAANKKWYEAGIATYIVRMPEGEDVLSSGIPVQELIDTRSWQPRIQTKRIRRDQTKFLRVETKEDPKTKETTEKVEALGDFAFWPIRELITDDGPAWEGKVTGVRDLVVLRNQDLNDRTKLTTWAGRHNARSFTGTQNDVQLIRNFVAAEADYLPLERATTKAGRIGRSFVWPENCIGADRLRYMAPSRGDAALRDKLFIADGPWETRAILALERLNAPGTMAIVLGWLTATLMRGMRAPAPPLFVAGESGSGKTHLVQTVLDAFGYDISANLTTTTPFGIDCTVSSTVGFPVWFDEYRTGARSDSMERLRQILRDAYNGQSSIKGGMTQNATELTEVTTWAGIIVSGEMGTSETSLRDRLVYLELDPANRKRAPYDYLHSEMRMIRGRLVSAKTAGLGHAFLTYLAGIPDSLFRIQETGDSDLPDRFRQVLGFIEAGWNVWLGFRQAVGLEDVPERPAFEVLSGLRRVSDDPWLEALRHAEGITDKNNTLIVEQTAEGLKIIPAEVVQEARRANIELPAGSKELVAWLGRRYKMEFKRMGSRRGFLVVGLNLNKAGEEE